MPTVRLLLAFSFLLFVISCRAATCHPPRGGILPLIPHCTELVHRILDTARTPKGVRPKEWGRQLANTATTVHLPKTYWIAGAGPRTCAVQVDVDAHSPDAVEKFTLRELGYAAEHIQNACLFRKGEVGTERVGLGRKVEVRLERVDLDAIRTMNRTLEGVFGESRATLWSTEGLNLYNIESASLIYNLSSPLIAAMAYLLNSKVALQASICFAVLSILALSGSIYQQTSIQTVAGVTDHHSLPYPLGSHHQLSPSRRHQHKRRYGANQQDTYPDAYQVLAHSSSTGIFQPQRNPTTAPPPFNKRADPDNRIDFEFYRCKGERYLANMRTATSKPPKWAFNNLAENGWKIKPGSINTFGSMLQRALTELRIFPPVGMHYDTDATLESEFTNHHGAKKRPTGTPNYENWYILPRTIVSLANTPSSPATTNVPGAIIGANNFGPKYLVNAFQGEDDLPIEGDALESLVPPLNSWADVVWAIWKQTAGGQAGDLRYIFQNHITTSTTKLIMEAIEGLGEDMADGMDLPYPGRNFKIDSANGLALLGSPHGVGVSWLYVNGRTDLGARNQITVSIFTGPELEGQDTGYFRYYMLWDLGPRS
ncbi:MAG: hypothetical protein Q9216_006284 [Gyalolechia sp. 2 TL-2023]